MDGHEPNVWKGVVAGVAAGLAASWAMTRFQVVVSGRGLSGSENPQNKKPVEGSDDAAMKASNEVAEATTGRPLTREEKTEIGGPAAHYAFGAAAGAAYGALREVAPNSVMTTGPAFGAWLWATADQLMLPLVGLSPWPMATYPLKTNAQHLAAHFVYGISTAAVYSIVRRLI